MARNVRRQGYQPGSNNWEEDWLEKWLPNVEVMERYLLRGFIALLVASGLYIGGCLCYGVYLAFNWAATSFWGW